MEKEKSGFLKDSNVMALRHTIKNMESLLDCLTLDLIKAEKGNKAAAQRVRTLSIQFAKTAKTYRKESVQSEEGMRKKRRLAGAKKSGIKKKTATRKRR